MAPGLAFDWGEDRCYLLLDRYIRSGHLGEDLRARPREGGLIYLSGGPHLPESVSFVGLTTSSADGVDVTE